ncbi:hypothetical protein GpartN1_g6657.t1 [Galdieria partita]|uniref:SET domain-containing protein n=1 Tax=Galdieria partita TaxID=83374 RepID=A0A9C7PRI2_9RHOD|nr:hypothetical protein GpartN1_g940.t1 [Galdieria partita]GJQ14866.1 hypothetical protein GpartN1_g6657.t1 [Galdieria partita]
MKHEQSFSTTWIRQEFLHRPGLAAHPRISNHMMCFVNVTPIRLTDTCCKLMVRRYLHKPIFDMTRLRRSSRLPRLFVICSNRRLELFYEWLKRRNVYSPKIKLGQNSCGLRGVVAVADIDCNESFLKVPRELSLQVTELDECPMIDFIDPELWSQESWYVKLSLKLLKERYLGELSNWKPYVDMLPHALNTGLVYWSSNELMQLQYRPLIEEVNRNQSYRQALYKRIFESLPFRIRVWLQNENENVFFWALDMVQSRAFGIPDDGNKTYALLPMMDMLNHRMNSPAHFMYDTKTNQYEMKTCTSLSQGSDIYISYGPLDNDHLLHFYGFLETNNPADHFQVTDIFHWLHLTYEKEWQAQPSHLLEEKLSLLRKYYIHTNEKTFRLYYDHYDNEIDIILRTFVASITEWQQLQENFASGLFNKALSLENELHVWQIIMDGCKHLLKDMETTVEEDEQLLKSSNQLSTRLQLAIQFRMEKKYILLATISRLEHFQQISKKTGRIITVLLPPTMKRISLKYNI